VTTLHEWRCPRCERRAESRTGPPKPTALLHKVVICKDCKIPMKPTGGARRHYSLRELL